MIIKQKIKNNNTKRTTTTNAEMQQTTSKHYHQEYDEQPDCRGKNANADGRMEGKGERRRRRKMMRTK